MNQIQQTDEPSSRVGWQLSNQHQIALALLGSIALLAVCFSYGWSAWQGEQADIDQAGLAAPRVFQVDVNHAAIGELMAVPNVGPKMAQAIVDYRAQEGPFESLDELQNVPGIGAVKSEQLKEYLLPID